MNQKQLTSVMWSFAAFMKSWGTARRYYSSFYHKAERRMVELGPSIKPPNQCSLIYSFAQANRGSADLFRRFESELKFRFSRLNDSQFANLVYAYATSNQGSGDFYQKALERFAQFRQRLSEKQTLTLLWSLAIRNVNFPLVLLTDYSKKFLGPESNLNSIDTTMLLQIINFVSVESSEIYGKELENESFQQLVSFARSWPVRKLANPRDSPFQRDVLRVLGKFQDVSFEQDSFIETYNVDLLIGEKVIVEMNGPQHYFNGTKTLRAPSLMKYRQLEKFGYKVVLIPYYDWHELGKDDSSKMRYLRHTLKSALA